MRKPRIIVFEREFQKLEKQAKPLEELTRNEEFYVGKVLFENQQTPLQIDPWKVKIGPSNERYFLQPMTKIHVSPKEDLPIRTITFPGYSAVRAGDTIIAAIPRFEEIRYEHYTRSWEYENCIVPFKRFFIDRPYQPEEEAKEIVILDEKRRVVRVERTTWPFR